MNGFAAVGLKTTGLHPVHGDRIVEVAVVHVSPAGRITGKWETLVNPERDLGTESLHGITGGEVHFAPLFKEIAGQLAGLLRGRVLVAHHKAFDDRFLDAEFGRCGFDVPLAGLSTMTLAHEYLPGSGRALADCCANFGVEVHRGRGALADAEATAGLLTAFLRLDDRSRRWANAMQQADFLPWPQVPCGERAWCARTPAADVPQHFLSSLVQRLRDPDLPERYGAYLAVLDRALLGHHVTASQGLSTSARELGICRAEAQGLHGTYLRDLAVAAWADGMITESERADLRAVTALLGCDPSDLDEALADTRPAGHETRPLLRSAATMGRPSDAARPFG